MQHIYLRWPRVKAATGLSRSTVWRLEQAGLFPRRRQLAPNSVGWSSAEIDAWLATRQHVVSVAPLGNAVLVDRGASR